MKQFQLTEFGIDNLTPVDVETPDPGPGEVLVRFRAASINYRDFMIVQGMYNPKAPKPLVPLSDGAGDVVAVGDGVTDLAVDDRVLTLFWPDWMSGPARMPARAVSAGCETAGAAREYGVYKLAALVRVPDSLSYAAAATLPCAALTAWSTLTTLAGVGPGSKVLAMGTGGVAIFALQLAKALGAEVVITSSSDEKLERARALGADHTINYKADAAWGETAYQLTGGIDCVVETGGAGTLPQSIAAAGFDGHIGIIGAFTGLEGPFNEMGVVFKNLHLHGLTVGSRSDMETMLTLIVAKGIEPVIDRTYGFDEIPQAIGAIAKGAHFGKLVVAYD